MSFHHRMEGADLHPPSRRFVENNNASSIPFLRAVTFSGFGDRPEIFLADGATDIIRGVAASTLLASTVGVIVQIGLIEDADTSGFVLGDILYADASGVLSTVVNGPAIAEVLEINASTGVIYVDTSGGGINASNIPNTDIRVKVSATDTTAKFLSSALVAGSGISTSILSPGGDEGLQLSLDAITGQLNDISASTPVANDLLIFNSAAGAYVPRTLTAGSNIDIVVNASQIVIGVSNISSASVLNDLGDVNASPVDGDFLTFNASAGVWEAGDASNGITLAFEWRFSTDTNVGVDPGNARFRYNSSTPASITVISFDDIDNSGFDIGTIFGQLLAGDRVYIQQKNDSTKAQLFEITASATDNTGYWTVPVTTLEAGALPDNNAVSAAVFLFTGGRGFQNIWETISADSGSQAAGSGSATLAVIGLGGLVTTMGSSTLSISASTLELGDLADVAAAPRTEGAMMSYNASATEFQFDRVAYTTISGEPFLTLVDPTRSNKILSVEATPFTFGRNKLNNNDWLRTGGNAGDAESGVIIPRTGTIVRATGHCADSNSNTQTIELYEGASSVGVLGSVVTASVQAQFNNTQDIDIGSDSRLRIRAGASAAGQIEDTIVTIWVRWRG